MSASATSYHLGSRNFASFEVLDASAGLCVFPIEARGAQAFLAGSAFRAAPARPGQGLLGLAFLDQRDGTLGAHRQAALLVATCPPTRPTWLTPLRGAVAVARRRVPFHVVQHPTESEAVRAVGADLFGFPSSLHAVDVRYERGRVECDVSMHGKHVLTLSMPRGGVARFASSPIEALGTLGGAPHRVRGRCTGEGVTEGGRHVELLLGDHPLSDRLRRLGLPKRPYQSLLVEAFRANVSAPERLETGKR